MAARDAGKGAGHAKTATLCARSAEPAGTGGHAAQGLVLIDMDGSGGPAAKMAADGRQYLQAAAPEGGYAMLWRSAVLC
jgi:hypothetical protein